LVFSVRVMGCGSLGLVAGVVGTLTCAGASAGCRYGTDQDE
jgi:hypothetical protein